MPVAARSGPKSAGTCEESCQGLIDAPQVEGLVDKAVQGGETLWRVRWHGYTAADDTWEPTGDSFATPGWVWYTALVCPMIRLHMHHLHSRSATPYLRLFPCLASVIQKSVRLLAAPMARLWIILHLCPAAECLDMGLSAYKWLGTPDARPAAMLC